METEPTQFTLEGNEVAQIANLDATTAVAAEDTASTNQQQTITSSNGHDQDVVVTNTNAEEKDVTMDQAQIMEIDDHEAEAAAAAARAAAAERNQQVDENHINAQVTHVLMDEEAHRPTWHTYFQQLQAHKATYGTLDVDPLINPMLYTWVDDQRKCYRNLQDGDVEALSHERILLLDAIDFDWDGSAEPNYGAQAEAAAGVATSNLSGSAQDIESFHARLAQLEQFKKETGSANVPETYKEDTMLGRWVAQQRALYRKQTLTQDRIDALATIGFDFAPGEKKVLFDKRLEQLKEYKAINGHVNIPRRCPENPSLGEWLYCQKKQYRRWENDQKGGMNETKRTLLEEVGVDFSIEADVLDPQKIQNQEEVDDDDSPNRSSKWDDKFHELRAYKIANGHTNVPRRSKRNPVNDALGEWVHFQRRQYRNLLNGKNSTLTIARKKALEYLDFQWYRSGGNSFHQQSAQNLDNNTKQLSVRDAVQSQIIKAHEVGKMLPWEDRFAQLTEYVQRFGNADVPINFAENLSLGSWVFRQRIAYKVWNDEAMEMEKKTREAARVASEENVDDEQKTDQAETGTKNANNVGKEQTESSDVLQKPELENNDESDPVVTTDSVLQAEETNPPAETNLPIEPVHDAPALPPLDLNNQQEVVTGSTPIYLPENGIPFISDVDKMTQERYDKLVAVGFDFKIKKIPDDFITEDRQEPALMILSKTVDEEEKPVLEDNQDVIEISLGEEEITTTDENEIKKDDVEINEIEVTEILEGNNDHEAMPALDTGIATQVEGSDRASADSANEVEDSTKQGDASKLDNQQHEVVAEGSEDSKVDPVAMQTDADDLDPAPMEDPMSTSDNVQTVTVPTENEVENHENAEVKNEIENTAEETNAAKPSEIPSLDAMENIDDTPNPKKRKLAVTVDVDWEERVLELIQYKLRKRSCNVPMKWKPNCGLAGWVWRQREQYRLYRAGEPSNLTTTRIAKLTELGFEFVIHDNHGNPIYHDTKKTPTKNAPIVKPLKRTPVQRITVNTKPTPKSRFKEGKWLQSLSKVVAYKEEFGNCNVPRKWKKDPTLGEWVHFQRRQFRLKQLGRHNHMTDERIARLEAIGFEWSRGTANPSNYSMRMYGDQKEMYNEQKIEDPNGGIVIPSAEHLVEMTPLEITQPVVDVVDAIEQHIAVAEQPLLNNSTETTLIDGSLEHIETEDMVVDNQMEHGQPGNNEDTNILSV